MTATLALAALAPSALAADGSVLNDPDRSYQVALHAELGFVAPLTHTIQFGQDGTRFDYVDEGGQDNLFPFARASADLHLGRHSVTLLYQPLDLRTEVLARRDVVVDGVTFPEGTPMELRYGFSFWRASWLYDLLADPERELGLGLSLQIRNATIDFASADGELLVSNRNIGPVPVLKIRGRTPVGQQGAWVGGEIDGFYAPIRYLNGGTTDVEGAIVDASLRAGLTLDGGAQPFLNLRWIGGGASGTSDSSTPPGDGYNDNWLNLLSLSLGVSLR